MTAIIDGRNGATGFDNMPAWAPSLLHTDALGTACGTEYSSRNAKGALVNDYFGGIFQYAYPDQGSVRYGYFATGARIVDTSGP